MPLGRFIISLLVELTARPFSQTGFEQFLKNSSVILST
jgi:hypothetical protein